MDDKTTAPSQPDMVEYKFADPEVASEPVTEQQPAAADSDTTEENVTNEKFGGKGIFDAIRNTDKSKFVVFGLIVLAIVLIYVISSYYGSKKTSLAEQKKFEEQEVTVVQRPIVTTPPMVTQPAAADLVNEQIEKLSASMQQKINEAVQESAKSNSDKIADLTNAVAKTQQEISEINQAINQLMTSIQQVATDVQKLKPKPKKRSSRPLAVYHIRAIVPGRVWLESSNGKSVTLRVGDRLNGYGKVETISPQKGTVLMSNGSIIQYGVNDF